MGRHGASYQGQRGQQQQERAGGIAVARRTRGRACVHRRFRHVASPQNAACPPTTVRLRTSQRSPTACRPLIEVRGGRTSGGSEAHGDAGHTTNGDLLHPGVLARSRARGLAHCLTPTLTPTGTNTGGLRRTSGQSKSLVQQRLRTFAIIAGRLIFELITPRSQVRILARPPDSTAGSEPLSAGIESTFTSRSNADHDQVGDAVVIVILRHDGKAVRYRGRGNP